MIAQPGRKTLSFILCGGAAALVQLAGVYACVGWLGLSPARANLLAFVPAFGVSFLTQRRYTFASKAPVGASLARWLATSLCALLLNQALYLYALRRFPAYSYLPLLITVTVLVAMLTFLAGQLWAFAEADQF